MSSISTLSANLLFQEKTFEAIDKEIENHLAIIIVLKNRRNRIAPISKLPPEILCHIFDFDRRDSVGLKWIRLTYVCRAWRDVAINTPSLWTILPLHNTVWSKEMLLRSKMASLTVDGGGLNVNSSLLENIVSNHMSRVKIFDVRFRDLPNVLEMLPKSAPTLETLILTLLGLRRGCRISPHSLLEMPRIRSLELNGFQIDWDLHLHSTLTVLKLRYAIGQFEPTEAQFWNALERMPLLETLDLQYSLPVVFNPSISRTKLYFKNLRKLKVISTAAATEQLLENISLPKTTIVSISCSQGTGGSSNFAGVCRMVASHLQSNKISMAHLNIDFEEAHSNIRFDLSCSIPEHFRFLPSNRLLSLEFSWKASPYNAENAIRDVFNYLPVDSVKDLRIIDGSNRLSISELLDTFGTLPQLRRLSGNLGQNFLRSMQRTLPKSNPSGRPKPSFPKLRTIYLDGASFAGRTPPETGDITTDDLLDCFIWRYEHGAEIYSLELESCVRLSYREVELLREIVVDVIWDGEEFGFSDDDDEDEDEDDSEDMYSPPYDGFYRYDDTFYDSPFW